MDLSAPAPRPRGKGMRPNAFIPWHVVSSVCAPGDPVFPHSEPERLAAARGGWERSSEDTVPQVHGSICSGGGGSRRPIQKQRPLPPPKSLKGGGSLVYP